MLGLIEECELGQTTDDNGCAVLRLCILYGVKGEPKRKARSGGVAVYILACTADDAGVCGLAGVVFVECAIVFVV